MRALIATAFSIGLVASAIPASEPAVAAQRVVAAVRDSDGDGLRDKWEVRYGLTSPGKRDSDGDGVIDSAEDLDGDRLGNLGEQRWRTHPGKKDTDGDGTPDGAEDENGNGITNAREQDRRRLPARLRPALGKAQSDTPAGVDRCKTGATSARLTRCWFGPSGSKTRVAFVGDSHALGWLPAAKIMAQSQRWRLATLFKGGCTPLLGTITRYSYRSDKGRSCRAWQRAAYAWLAKQDLDLVVITHSDSSKLMTPDGTSLAGDALVAAWRAGASRTIDAMPDASKVVLMGDVPRNRVNPIKCLARSRGVISKCVTYKEPLHERKIERAFRQAAADRGAQFHTLYSQICSYDPCPLVQGNVLMWRDRHHLTATFTMRLAPSLKSLFKAGLAGAAERAG